VIAGASSSAQQFVGFIMSSSGQQILTSHGFTAEK